MSVNQFPLETYPKIENKTDLALPADTEDILAHMFAAYERVEIKAEFNSGFSGSRVLLVQPIKDRPVLQVVVKLAPIHLIQQEWQAYQRHIHERVFGVASIEGEVVCPPGSSWGGLRYPLVGGGVFKIESLYELYNKAPLKDMWHVFENRLFRHLEPIWNAHTEYADFQFQGSYDLLLPINLLIEPTSLPSDAPCYPLQPDQVGHHADHAIKSGEYVGLNGFVISEIDQTKKEITLNVPNATPAPHIPPISYRIRLKSVQNIESYHVNDTIHSISGKVLATRQELLQRYAEAALGAQIDLSGTHLTLPGNSIASLPNPLSILPDLLHATRQVNVSIIHGDLNLENVLIDPEARTVSLIDFALARQDHVMHDFLRLETGIITRLLPEELAKCPRPEEMILRLYRQLHAAATSATQFGVPEELDPALKKIFVMLVTIRKKAQQYLRGGDEWGEYYDGLTIYLLSALKFKNLTPLAKQIAFWGAATATGLRQAGFSINKAQHITWHPLATVLEEGETPFMAPPRAPHELVGHNTLLPKLKAQLLAERNQKMVALYGLPGVGKTTLAIELAHDEELLEHFKDGVLWTGLCYQPDLFALLGAWGSALGMSSEELAQLTDLRARAQAIHRKIGLRRMLLVVDDAWQSDAALAFKVGGPNCAYVLTTRQPDIAWDFASNRSQRVHELSEEDSMTLLANFVPKVVMSQPDEARALVRAAGGLPLALLLMGRYLQKAASRGTPHRLRSALKRLKQAPERLRLTQPLSLLEQPACLSAGVPLSLWKSIEISDMALDEAASQALRALSLFPAKPNSFSEEAALAITNQPIDVLDTLIDAGLLENSHTSRYTLHQAIADYATINRPDLAASQRMVSFFVNLVQTSEKKYDLLEQELNNILIALDIAFANGMSVPLIKGTNQLCHVLEVRGWYDLAETLLERVQHSAKAINDRPSLLTTLLNLGRILAAQGNYARAQTYLMEGRRVARGIDTDDRIELLRQLGIVLAKQDAYEEAERYLQEGLALARSSTSRELISDLLMNLGSVMWKRGAYQQAERHLQEGLTLARALGQPEILKQLLTALKQMNSQQGTITKAQERVALAQALNLEKINTLLVNLSTQAGERGAYQEAEAYLQEALALARTLEQPELISQLLLQLAELTSKQRKNKQSNAYFQEGLARARGMEHHWLISRTLLAWGNHQIQQHNWEQAALTFNDALETAQEVELQNFVGQAKYGLAQIAYAQGDISTARQEAKESLAILEAMAHDDATQVKEWLTKHPLPRTHHASTRFASTRAVINRLRDVATQANKRLNGLTMPSLTYNWGLV